MKVTVAGTAAKRCPYRDEPDLGTFNLTFYVPGGDAPELHDLADRVKALGEAEAASHEDFTRALMVETGADKVVTTWTTAGLDVTCEL